jgi:hypothetical protein
MDHNAHTTADPREVQRAQEAWDNFTAGAKLATAVIIIGTILLALITL